jgi:hypothetical protein
MYTSVGQFNFARAKEIPSGSAEGGTKCIALVSCGPHPSSERLGPMVPISSVSTGDFIWRRGAYDQKLVHLIPQHHISRKLQFGCAARPAFIQNVVLKLHFTIPWPWFLHRRH